MTLKVLANTCGRHVQYCGSKFVFEDLPGNCNPAQKEIWLLSRRYKKLLNQPVIYKKLSALKHRHPTHYQKIPSQK